MNAPLPILQEQCWQGIGVWGDRSCPDLSRFTHCHNCPVFATAGRRFLDAPPPERYSAEWAEQLAEPDDESRSGLLGALVFRLGNEWLALPVGVLVEVTHPRRPHRVPHRGGLLAGIVNLRGELHLAVRLDLLLGIDPPAVPQRDNPRLISIRQDSDSWVFSADEVDQVHRVDESELAAAPPTLQRSSSRLTRGVFNRERRAIGFLDDERLFHTLRERAR